MAQYQHYIPQFLLRNFSRLYKPPKGKGPDKKGKSRTEKGEYGGDKVVNVVDLKPVEPQLLESPVSRWFGQDDMYKDDANVIESKKYVEKELSRLESRTAEILRKVKKAHESGNPGIWVSLVERNTLSKFLFIMKYRGPTYYKKYFLEDPQMYDSEEKHLLRAYMDDKGMARPRDVWLHNLRTILDVDMDAEEKWMTKLPELMYPADAEWFIYHIEFSYTAFCTPTEKYDEFLLTDQCHHLMEGPMGQNFCANTDEERGGTDLCYHEFAPLSPRLVIVLRSNTLPEALEQWNPDRNKIGQTMPNAALAQFRSLEDPQSILFDLPVARAFNAYSRTFNGRQDPAPVKDRSYFQFWSISTRHVVTINSILQDNLLEVHEYCFWPKRSFSTNLRGLYGHICMWLQENWRRRTRGSS